MLHFYCGFLVYDSNNNERGVELDHSNANSVNKHLKDHLTRIKAQKNPDGMLSLRQHMICKILSLVQLMDTVIPDDSFGMKFLNGTITTTRRITACTRAGPCSKKLDCYVYATRSTTRRLTAEEQFS